MGRRERLTGGLSVAIAAMLTAGAVLASRPAGQQIAPLEPILSVGGQVLWLAVFTAAALGLGGLAARALRLTGGPLVAAWPVELCLGAGVLAAAAGTLGALGLLARVPLFALLAAGAAVGLPRLPREGRRYLRGLGRAPAIPLLLLLGAAAISLLATVTPAPFYDQFHYHLAFPERWLRTGSIDVIERHTYSYFPANMGLLYAYALAGPGLAAAQAINWWTGVVAGMGSFALARRLGARRRASWWAPAMLVATPAVLLPSSWAAADLGPACFGCAALLLLTGAARGGTLERDLAAGALAGLAFGSKYLALATVALPLVVGSLFAGALTAGPAKRRARAATLRSLACATGVALAFAPWALRNLALTGNPVYPFFADLFAQLFGGSQASQALASAGAVASPVEPGTRLYAALTLRTFAPKGEAGAIGPLWILLVPAWIATGVLLARRRAELVALAVAVSGIVLWSQFHQLGRYLVPVLVVAAAGAALTCDRLRERLSAAPRALFSLFLALMLAWGVSGGVDRVTLSRVGCALGQQDTDELLESWVSYWRAVPYVNGELPADARVLLVAESRSLRIDRDVVVEDPFRTPLLVELAESAADGSALARRLREDGITHVLFNEHEADRMSRLNGRRAYLEPRSAGGTRTIQEFFAACVEPLARRGPAVVYRLRGRCEPGATLEVRAGRTEARDAN